MHRRLHDRAAETCDLRCERAPIEACQDGDGCCPAGLFDAAGATTFRFARLKSSGTASCPSL